ncbi:peptidase M1 family protein [Jejuia pallidilutea]|uniref:Peptidase M1 family protein n=1 Tax=Jejuia pallidilutea TaxID=504487 RepID=A0A090W121_9FLAO|nr:peptidase M1 family protein [Jejuia pallidilutea]
MINYKYLLFLFISFLSLASFAQGLLQEKKNFSRQDTLRGSITPEREWWDLTYYHLDIKVEPDKKFISGKNTIQYKVLKENSVMQIDLQSPMKLLKATQNGNELTIKHDGNAHFISLIEVQNVGDVNSIEVYYEGHPKEAVRAPWDGGISWRRDINNNHFIASSVKALELAYGGHVKTICMMKLIV